jgi:hypothetical protein
VRKLICYFPFKFQRGKKINSITKWMGIVVGTVGMLLSFFMIYKKSSEKVSSTTSVIATDLKNIQSVATIAK